MEIRNKSEIRAKVIEIEDRLKELDRAFKIEFEKEFFSRDRMVFLFINVEKKMYVMALNELKWVLNE
jgi:hypothetical protein